MALIKCPECGKEVSDKAKMCVFCGYPINDYNDNVPKLKRIVMPALTKENALKQVRVAVEITGVGIDNARIFSEQKGPVVVKDKITEDEASYLALKFKAAGIDVQIVDSDTPIDTIFSQIPITEDKIHCPRCGSTEYHAGARGYSIWTGFLGSGQTVITCLKCGYKWKPKR